MTDKVGGSGNGLVDAIIGIGSTIMDANASSNAAQANTDALNRAVDLSGAMYEQGRQDQAPFRQTGVDALGLARAMVGLGPMSLDGGGAGGGSNLNAGQGPGSGAGPSTPAGQAAAYYGGAGGGLPATVYGGMQAQGPGQFNPNWGALGDAVASSIGVEGLAGLLSDGAGGQVSPDIFQQRLAQMPDVPEGLTYEKARAMLLEATNPQGSELGGPQGVGAAGRAAKAASISGGHARNLQSIMAQAFGEGLTDAVGRRGANTNRWGLPGFARGGFPVPGQMIMVGEQGPETMLTRGGAMTVGQSGPQVMQAPNTTTAILPNAATPNKMLPSADQVDGVPFKTKPIDPTGNNYGAGDGMMTIGGDGGASLYGPTDTAADPAFGGGGVDVGIEGYDVTTDPSYQFRMNEGIRAIENSAAARGSILSGGTIRGVSRFASDLASQEFGNIYNRVAGLIGVGQAAAANTAVQGSAYAGQAAQLYQGIGSSNAAGILGRNSAIQQGLGSIYGRWP